jgi:hypothetical protein
MSKRIGFTAVVACLFCVAGVSSTTEAQARGVRWSVSVGNSFYGGYGRVHRAHYPRQYNRSFRQVYHQGGHYDYHGPSMTFHGNHIDYMPGHLDYHQTGHRGHRGHHRAHRGGF